ncbi:MAG: thymidine kinase [Planctomycetota bacterium]|nr:thymidine kinase [Planctomycetota bacterium]
MAKLYFRYGAVGSAKTLNLLAVAHQYERQGKRVLVLKPAFDTRFSAVEVVSRAGLHRSADRVLADGEVPPSHIAADADCVLVDEAQFLTEPQVEALRDWTRALGVPVICYGLRADFRSRLFEGSLRLLELADSIEEIKTTCAWCNRKATQNLKYVDGRASIDGPSRQLGAEERYQAVCYRHYREQLDAARDAGEKSADGLGASVAPGGARV